VCFIQRRSCIRQGATSQGAKPAFKSEGTGWGSRGECTEYGEGE